ncbi:HIT family protein [Nocardia transvalensis]|uniref:HIT family protein n=1 Tax=Nocardia transvalensis TaxID=37333 RepID=UPI0018961BD5|nr:HIT domain-containing protein [Nocardia transvalensis]MBF6330626.1 HIT domain-containing protein [Nocardia transvalensis]
MGTTGLCDRSDLCAEFSGTTDTEFTRTYFPMVRRCLAETADSVAVVDLSPLVVGHVLVCPRAHYFSAAQAIADITCDFGRFLERFLRVYAHIFGGFTLLEHGSTAAMRTACISHAHVHVLPLALEPIIGRMSYDGLSLTLLDSWQGVIDLCLDRSPYYLAADGDRFFVARPPQRLISQYLRVVAGAAAAIPPEECDWAVVIRHEIFQRTIQRWAVGAATEGVML